MRLKRPGRRADRVDASEGNRSTDVNIAGGLDLEWLAVRCAVQGDGEAVFAGCRDGRIGISELPLAI